VDVTLIPEGRQGDMMTQLLATAYQSSDSQPPPLKNKK